MATTTDTLKDVDLFPFDNTQPVLVLYVEGKEPQELRIGAENVVKLAWLALNEAVRVALDESTTDACELSWALAEACKAYLEKPKA